MSAAILGIDPTEVGLANRPARFKLGTLGGYDHPTLGYQEFVYGRAAAGITGIGFICTEGADFAFTMATTANTAPGTAGGPGSRVGAAQAALLINQFGWFQIYGRGSVRTAASAAIGTRLNTTATAGAVDDDGTAGARPINGAVLAVATGGAAATNPNAVFSYPTVAQTI
jgi:hypothetical protein